MELVAEPVDDLGDPAVVVGVFFATSRRLGESLGDFGVDRFGVRLGAGIERGGIAGGVAAQTGDGATQAESQLVKEVTEGGLMRLLSEDVEEAGHVVALGDL